MLTDAKIAGLEDAGKHPATTWVICYSSARIWWNSERGHGHIPAISGCLEAFCCRLLRGRRFSPGTSANLWPSVDCTAPGHFPQWCESCKDRCSLLVLLEKYTMPSAIPWHHDLIPPGSSPCTSLDTESGPGKPSSRRTPLTPWSVVIAIITCPQLSLV